MEEERDLRFFPHLNDPTYCHTMWEFRLFHPTEQQIYDINRRILQSTVWAAVFNIEDIVSPLPPGANRFVYMWGLIIFNNDANLAEIQQFITPLGTWTPFNRDHRILLNQTREYLESDPNYRAIMLFDPNNIHPLQ
jgi:hypothetical protein